MPLRFYILALPLSPPAPVLMVARRQVLPGGGADPEAAGAPPTVNAPPNRHQLNAPPNRHQRLNAPPNSLERPALLRDVAVQVRLQTFEFMLKYEEKAKELRESIAAVRVVRPSTTRRPTPRSTDTDAPLN
eukprot:SAG25_NODE_152_length_13602_cov_15.382878_4_plen_131_part_00